MTLELALALWLLALTFALGFFDPLFTFAGNATKRATRKLTALVLGRHERPAAPQSPLEARHTFDGIEWEWPR